MSKYDKDRFQKELAIRYCLARGMVPFLEVAVSNVSDLSDSIELLTDLDVLGIELVSDGGTRREIFDCKTTNKMSSINRAFWAAGVMSYTASDRAYVVLKTKAVHNHRISALSIGVDLHTEESFKDLGKSFDPSFPAEMFYQSSVTRWEKVSECYDKNIWSKGLFSLARHSVPLAESPGSVFRRFIAELRSCRGQFDPEKDAHVTIFLDCLAAILVLWTPLSRDARRFYEPDMAKPEFEKTLRYYLWGGKESYLIRQQMREKAMTDGHQTTTVEMPAWDQLLHFVGLVIASPVSIFECANFVREIEFRLICGADSKLDHSLTDAISKNPRLKQFSLALSDYLVVACGLPKDLGKKVQSVLLNI